MYVHDYATEAGYINSYFIKVIMPNLVARKKDSLLLLSTLSDGSIMDAMK